MFEMIIFDMDGVIVDTESAYHEVEMALFRELDLDISEEERYRYVGTKTEEMWFALKQKYAIPHSVESLVEMETRAILSYLKSTRDIKPVPGVVSLIRNLYEKQVVLALASSSHPPEIDAILELFDLKKYFSHIISGDEVENGKPAPDIFLEVCRRAGIDPAGCLIIEDSKNGVLSAKSAGIKSIGYRNPGSGNQDLSKANMVIDNFDGLNFNVLNRLFREA